MNEDPSTGRHDRGAADETTVSIEIPAELRYVSLTRVAAASLAADLDPSMDDIEDLRVAVNELVGLLVEATDGGYVVVRMRCEGQTLQVTGRCTNESASITPDGLTGRILDATVDDYEIADGAFRMHKRLGIR